MPSDSRPLSPHLQVYRWQMTMALSILHRLSGVGLALGLILLTWWLVAAASGASYFDYVHMVMTSLIGRVIMFGFTLALFLHMCNGIRHLFWDAGYGFEIETASKNSWLVLIAAVVLTLAVFFIGYGAR
jgi:succinate dehydrogenase / fumarate reductase cytochrome b subunit